MCDPMTAIGIGLSAAGQVAGFAGQSKAVDNYNAAAKQNAVNAGLAATRQYQDEGFKRAYDARVNNEDGYMAIMKARQAKGTGVASAGTSGLGLNSVSVDAVLSGIDNAEAHSAYNTELRNQDSEYAYRSRVKSYEAQAQGRINSMPYKEGPSPLGLALGIATDAFGIAAKSPKVAGKINAMFGAG